MGLGSVLTIQMAELNPFWPMLILLAGSYAVWYFVLTSPEKAQVTSFATSAAPASAVPEPDKNCSYAGEGTPNRS